MKKINLINLKGISEILSEKELKNVMGGSGSGGCNPNSAWGSCLDQGDCWGVGLPGRCKFHLGLYDQYCACVH